MDPAAARNKKLDLVALVWIGRGDYAPDDWETARAEAAAVRDKNFVEYTTYDQHVVMEVIQRCLVEDFLKGNNIRIRFP